jgi:hypothetical protein
MPYEERSGVTVEKRRARKRRLALCAGLAFVLFSGCGGFLYLALGMNNEGSPALAQEWKTALQEFNDLEDAKHHDQSVQGRVFPDGEWVLGKCRNSHGLFERGGGTLVVKDSRGAIRAFFGHVCGPDFLKDQSAAAKSLDDFYRRLTESGIFAEHQLK